MLVACKSDTQTDLVIAKLDSARQSLVEAKTVQETKYILDVATAAEVLAKRQSLGEEAIGYAHAIKTEALAQLGKLLKEMPKATGAKGVGPIAVPQQNRNAVSTLAEIGISKKTSMVAQQLAALPDDTRQKIAEREQTLKQALLDAKKNLHYADFSSPSSGTCTVDDLNKLLLQGKTFGTIYADPPWSYGNQGTRAATDNHYNTMSIEEIAALPVASLASEQSHIHLWTTNAFLHDSFHLLEHWGFEFKSLLVWDKDRFGIGNYWRLQTEYLLLGTKGGLTFSDHSQPNIVRMTRTQHSAKPEAIRKMIEKVSPGPRLEMFARRVATGWTCWGNEIEKTMFDADVEEVA